MKEPHRWRTESGGVLLQCAPCLEVGVTEWADTIKDGNAVCLKHAGVKLAEDWRGFDIDRMKLS